MNDITRSETSKERLSNIKGTNCKQEWTILAKMQQRKNNFEKSVMQIDRPEKYRKKILDDG